MSDLFETRREFGELGASLEQVVVGHAPRADHADDLPVLMMGSQSSARGDSRGGAG
jgi:hypothetical protein